MRWHVPEVYLAAYAAGELDDPEAWSLEIHVTACPQCAVRVAEAAHVTGYATRVAGVRQAVLERAQREVLQRSRVGSKAQSRMWRLLTAVPALRLPWIAAAALTIASALVLGRFAGDDAPAMLLLLAPLLPLAGVGATYGPGLDPAYEIVLASPFSGFRLLLLRTVTVLGVTVPLLLGGALISPITTTAAVSWLLPALALVLLALMLGAFVDIRVAAALVGAGWAAAVLLPKAAAMPMTYVLEPRLQLMWTVTALIAAALAVAQREAYDRMEG